MHGDPSKSSSGNRAMTPPPPSSFGPEREERKRRTTTTTTAKVTTGGGRPRRRRRRRRPDAPLPPRRPPPSSLLLFLSTLLAATTTTGGDHSDGEVPLSYPELPPCDMSSYDISNLGPNDELYPCVVADIRPEDGSGVSGGPPPANRSALVTMVQVTPSGCNDHRDGSLTGVRVLNEDSDGWGVKIGFASDYFVRFRLVSVIAGNPANIGTYEYNRRHVAILNSLLDTIKPQYIVGTCSFVSTIEKAPALEHKTIVMAQVGPPGFYEDVSENPYVFGFHINSDTYPLPAIRQLAFHVSSREQDMHAQPVRIVSRTKSEFFNSTCSSVLNEALKLGFVDTDAVFYDPDGDDDGNGIVNAFDEDFLRALADGACPPGSAGDDHPAIFACVNGEQDALLDRWRHNGCRPSTLWMTPATWQWANANPDVVPLVMGGGQWHEAFEYGDPYFESGKALIEYNRNQFGYTGNYDMVVSYAIPVLYSQHLASFFRVVDDPDVENAFRDRYEELRRGLVVLGSNTIFGPFGLDEFQRNIGRGSAGTQWLLADPPLPGVIPKRASPIKNKCVSPLGQAEAAVVVESYSSLQCDAGQFVDLGCVRDNPCLLCSKCHSCPADTYTAETNDRLRCRACEGGSATDGGTGSTECLRQDPHLLSAGIRAMGYVLVVVNWSLSLGFIIWVLRHKKDPVVQIGQFEFLILLCVGAMISTSTIISMSLAQAEVGEDKSGASAACVSIPFLYTIGWVLQYSSLSAKSYRLYKMLINPMRRRRRKVTAKDMYKIIAAALLLDLVCVVVWTVVDPLQYERKITGTNINPKVGVVTIESTGRCTTENDIWIYIAPLIVLHVGLMIVTNILLYKVRNVGERYQEQKYVALASIYVCELLLLGLPVLLAVSDNTEVTYLVLVGIIFLNDSGILCLIFIPKIMAQKEVSPQGLSVTQSVMGGTHSNVGTSIVDSGRLNPMDNGFTESERSVDRSSREYDSSGRNSNENSAYESRTNETLTTVPTNLCSNKSSETALPISSADDLTSVQTDDNAVQNVQEHNNALTVQCNQQNGDRDNAITSLHQPPLVRGHTEESGSLDSSATEDNEECPGPGGQTTSQRVSFVGADAVI